MYKCIKSKLLKKMLVAVLTLALLFTVYPIQQKAMADVIPGNPQLSRTVASEGMVLLENHGLPLAKGEKVSLFGSGQINFLKGGGGSGDVNVDYVVNLLQGMQNKEKSGEISIYKPLADAYTDYISKGGKGEMPLSDDQVTDAAKNSDDAIFTITRFEGEGWDRSATKGDYYLSDEETSILDRITKAGFKKVIVVLNIGAVMDTSWISKYPGISVLIAWYPGMEGGNAVADVLCGDVNPSGKLVDTFAKSYEDYPSSSNFKQNDAYVNYEEDIFNGYRYFETFDPEYKKVNYEFGYGLSYTTFNISDVNVSSDKTNINIEAKVTNTGKVAGKEVVQAYFSAPQGKLGKPGKQLAAFAKTKLLNPRESQTIEMSYPIKQMASYDDTGKVQKSAWILEPGDYNIYVGNSIKNAGLNGVRFKYSLDKLVIVSKLTEQLAPTQLPKRLLADGSYEVLNNTNPKPQRFDISPTDTTKIESEDYSEANTEPADSCPRIESFLENWQRGKCLAYMGNAPGNYVTYNVYAEEAGTYDITFRASNGGLDANNVAKIYVNGQLQPNVNINIPKTGDGSKGEWYNFIDLKPITITLPLGDVEIKVVSNGGFSGNFDYMVFKKSQNEQQTISSKRLVNTNDKRGNILSTVKSQDTNGKILLSDVYKDPSLMDKFIAQLSNEQLADLSQGKPAKIAGGTGGIGGLGEYGIPSAQTSDGPAGLRLATHTTGWPCETLRACTWDTDLNEKVGEAIGKEAKLNNVDIWLAPGMNIHRDPLNGRNFEYWSEDPLIAGKMGAAITKGVQSQGVGVTLKHFACNNKETNRSNSDSRVSERALREIYLKPFEIAVKESQPWCIMSSYNLINGTETAESYGLLTEILRNEWGYKGIVMTDWGNNSIPAFEVKAGNDVKMPSGDSNNILEALSQGYITRQDLERNIKNILNMIMKTQAFQKASEPIIHRIISTEKSRIKAIEYSNASDKIGSEICNDTDGGLNPTYTGEGEWLEYKINVDKGGTYKFYPRVATPQEDTVFDIYIDNNLVGTYNQKAATGGWQNWITGTPIIINVPTGDHNLKLEFTKGSVNVNWFEFEFNEQLIPTSIKVDPEDMALNVGDTKQVTATVYDQNNSPIPGINVNWTSDNPDVATVDNTGKITGVSAGTTTVKATYGDLSASVNVTINGETNNTEATLEGQNSIKIGNTYTLTYGLKNAKDISAQVITLKYDPNIFDYVKANSIIDGTTITATYESQPGTITFVLATTDKGKAINGDKEVLNITLKAKTLVQGTKITLTKGEISNTEGNIMDLKPIEKTINVVAEIDKTYLEKAIKEAKEFDAAIKEGINNGQYPEGTKSQLEEAIKEAQSVYDNKNVDQTTIDKATDALNNTVKEIKGWVITDTTGIVKEGETEISIGDLGIVATYFAATSNSEDWNKIKNADINHNNKIDLYDITFIARRIIMNMFKK